MKALNLSKKLPFSSTEDSLDIKAVSLSLVVWCGYLPWQSPFQIVAHSPHLPSLHVLRPSTQQYELDELNLTWRPEGGDKMPRSSLPAVKTE